MKKLFAKLFLACIPLFIVIGIYLYSDPFKVIRHYDNFYDDAPQMFYLNRDYISTESWLNNYDKYHYDSYIFGNSRSGRYLVSEWQKHINGVACFHFDAYLEGLYGLEKKLEFLRKKGAPVKNALFVIDHDVLSEVINPADPLYRKHPLVSGESWLDFQLLNFKNFLHADFITSNIKLLLAHKPAELVIDNNPVAVYQQASNEERWWFNNEALIAKNKDSFYAQRMNVFYKRSATQQYDTPIIKNAQKEMLINIKRMLDAGSSSYRIVISPLFDQKKLDTTDLALLISIFGKDKVFDFSGINEMTSSIYNYYEQSHYRPHIATQIMDSIYSRR